MRALGRIQRAASHTAGEAPRNAVRGAGPMLSVTIEQDREFGEVLAVSAARSFGGRRRVVRALPAAVGDLRDAVLELAALESGLPAAASDIVATLREIVESHSPGTEARFDLAIEAGALRRRERAEDR